MTSFCSLGSPTSSTGVCSEPSQAARAPSAVAVAEVVVLDNSMDDESALASTTCSALHRAQSSDVYVFIKHDATDANMPFFCLLCHEKIKRHRWKHRNTGNFCYHLQKEHKNVYSIQQDPSQSKLKHFFPPSLSACSSSSTGGTKRKGSTSTHFSTSDRTYADKKLVEDWVVNHAQPFSVVEQSDFIAYSAALREEYKLPTPKQYNKNTCAKSMAFRKKSSLRYFAEGHSRILMRLHD